MRGPAAQRIVGLNDSSERLTAEDALHRKRHPAVLLPQHFASSDRYQSEITNNAVEIRDLCQGARKIKDRRRAQVFDAASTSRGPVEIDNVRSIDKARRPS